MILNFRKYKIIVIKGGIIAIKSFKNEVFTGIINLSVGSLDKLEWKSHKIPKTEIANMEELIDNVKILINTLGCKVFVPVTKATDDTVYLYCKRTGANAKGLVSTGGFTTVL